MKNLYKFCFVLSLLIISLFRVHVTWAFVFAPIFDVQIIVNTTEGEAAFDYEMRSQPSGSPVVNDTQNFSIVTASSTGSYLTTTPVGNGDLVYLTQTFSSNWKMLEVYCTSPDSAVTTNLYSDLNGTGIVIISAPHSSVTCIFTNAKVVAEKKPVVIIPGILSSYLNRNDDQKTELWPNLIKALFGLPGDKYLDELALDEIGQPDLSYPIVLPADIFRKINNHDFFAGLIQKLESTGYEEGKNLFVFPYDWRLDIRQVVDGLYSPILTSLKDKINQILTQTGSEKVDIIAHSMGGLLTEYYIKNYGQSKVDKFIDIATPHLGAPSAFKTLMWGDDLGIKFGFLGLNQKEVKKIVQNMPSAYQLLPSENYFSADAPDYKYYVYNGKRLSYAETRDLLKTAGRNGYVLDKAMTLHTDLDLLNLADYGVKVHNIVGCGVPTIAKFFNLGREEYDVSYTSGDGTVPEKSSRNFSALQEYQITNTVHSAMPSREGVSDLVSKILADKIADYSWTNYEYVSTSTSVCNLPDGEIISFHGPVKLDQYEYGDQMIYDYIDNNTFIFRPLISEEPVKLTATRSGSATAHIKKFRHNQVVSTAYFDYIVLENASSTVEVDLSRDVPRVNNELPAVTVEGDTLDDLEPPITTVNIIPSATSSVVVFGSSNDDILKTEYALDQKEKYSIGTSTIITTAGTTTVYYYSVDKAGNLEEAKQIEIYLSPLPEDHVEAISLLKKSTSKTVKTRHISPVKEASREEAVVAMSEPTPPPIISQPVFTSTNEQASEDIPSKPESSSYYAAVVEAPSSDLKYYWSILAIVFILLLVLVFSKKLLKKLK